MDDKTIYVYRDAADKYIDGNRRLIFFFRYGHHGQTSFVGGGYFSFILYRYLCVVFFPHFSSPLAIIIWQECAPGIMYVRYGPTQPSFITNNISIPGVYYTTHIWRHAVCFLLCVYYIIVYVRLAVGDALFLQSLIAA